MQMTVQLPRDLRRQAGHRLQLLARCRHHRLWRAEVCKRALLAHFGSPEAVVTATREELQAVPGLPPKVARELHGHLHRAG